VTEVALAERNNVVKAFRRIEPISLSAYPLSKAVNCTRIA
jgi:hypothetical protein